MAADVALQDVGSDDDALEAGMVPPVRRLSGKKLVLFIILPILLLVGGVGGLIAAGIINPFGDSAAGEEAKTQEAADPSQLVFYDLPDMLVNLSTTGKRTSYLKIRVSLELYDAKNVVALQALAPRIIDNFQVYLRELRTDDLRGSAGMARLREELLRRVSAAVEPIRIRDVLFREMLVQ